MRKVWQKFLNMPAKILLYLFIASSIVCILALRHNNQTMVMLRNDVYVADKENKDINKALNKLRGYVYGHMNTNLSSGNNNIKPPIQLKYTYQRLYDAQASRVEQANQKIYTDAQNYCQSINSAYFGTTRVPCVQNYVINHGVKAANINIPAGLYQFDFISPTWSPDLAGWSIIASIIFLLALVIRFSLGKLQKKQTP